jgi:hypothetical protein
MSVRERFSAEIDGILVAASPMPLGSGSPDAELSRRIAGLNLEADKTIRDRASAQACVAGLWLRINELDKSHRISQELATPEGSYWHAIMHRREGDYGNSKYWLRRVGHHPVFAEMATNWDPFAFVDRVEACVTRGAGNEAELRELQMREWDSLFEYCWTQAVS